MSLARWDPFRELQTLENQMNRLFRRGLSEHSRPDEALTTSEFAPPVDVYDDDSKLRIKMDVPGIDAKDLDIRVDGNLLTVSGERKFENEEKKENFRRVEREYGSFSRSFTLPASADADNISANFENGTLQLMFPNAPTREQSRSKLPRDQRLPRKLRNSDHDRAGCPWLACPEEGGCETQRKGGIWGRSARRLHGCPCVQKHAI